MSKEHAYDAGSVNCPPPATDQRGVARPQGAGCDTVAVEYLPEPRGALALIAGAGFLGFLYRQQRRGASNEA
ncbi:MAG: choice-of-anchor Q domain-containing protein [Candidatus Krumholzibacteria bacterium]